MLRGLIIAGCLVLLALAPPALAADPPAPSTAAKVVKDPAEYAAYLAALNTTDPAARAAAMEAFVAGYPTSVVKVDALEQAMAAYQQGGDAAKVEATAQRILAIQPDDLPPLAIVVFLTRNRATTQSDAQASLTLADQAGASAERGLADLRGWPKPDGMTDADFAAQRDQMTAIFAGALGYRSLAHKDNAAAAPYYLTALQAQPGDLTNTYQLAIAELQSKPVDPAGFWWAARAYNLAGAAKNSAAQASIAAFAKASYRRYHGGDDGWDAIAAGAASGSAPPAGFTIAAAPTAAELAVKAVAVNDPRTLSFSDWEFVLAQHDASAANAQAADRVWAAIQAAQPNDAKMKLPIKVIAVTPDGFDGALTDQNQDANQIDVSVKLSAAPAQPPTPGAIVSVTGRLTGYTLQPFRFTLERAELTP
jgi:hypothetical protein